jgi:hypothetical protein
MAAPLLSFRSDLPFFSPFIIKQAQGNVNK